MTVEEMERELIKLDADGRSRVYYFLLDLMEQDGFSEDIPEEEYDRLWAEECKRRCEEIDAGKVELIPAEEVFARARAKLTKRQFELAGKLKL
ncbi:MAG: addiction module protein [Coriobacteriales bacterium]|jgi:hypothetical protein|nr:addiction module protein [Coriobacteriales bacterium]